MHCFVKIVTVTLLVGSCFGCVDSRVQRSDEEAMMLYRECMGGAPAHWTSSDVSAGLGSEHVASTTAGADSHRDTRQHHECVQQAGWREK